MQNLPMYKKILLALFLALTQIILVSGCGSSNSKKVIEKYPATLPSDNYLYCDEIKTIIEINQKQLKSLHWQKNKFWKNALLFIAGYFSIIPWFFLDFSDKEQLEYIAIKRRNAHLYRLARRKHCSDMPAKLKLEKTQQEAAAHG